MAGYDFELSGLMVTFRANPAHIEAAGSQTAGGMGTSVKISVKTSVKMPARILRLFGRSLRAVELASAKLVKEGWLKYVGPQKGGHWETIKKDGEK